MNAAAFLSELRRRDIEVSASGDELHCSAPAGALTPELSDELRRRKNELLQFLASAQALAGQQRCIVPLQARGGRTPVFAVPGHNGDVFCYRVLARSLGSEQPFFALQPPGLDGRGEPLARAEHIARRFADEISAFRPRGPYIIAGYCAGGTIAFELAQQLLDCGAAVRFVALFSSPYPAYFSAPTHLAVRVAHGAERISKHARELALRGWEARRQYIAAELAQRNARREALRAAALDPVLLARAKLERATIHAVRRYRPRHFPGRVCLFLPGRHALRTGGGELRWRALARVAETYFGPDGCDSDDMLREPSASAFAELFRRCCESGG